MFKCKKNCEKCKRFKNAYRGQGRMCPVIAEGYYFTKAKKKV